MISIVNKGPQTKDPGGERNYEVHNNGIVIAKFTHERRKGMAACLKAAAAAVEKNFETCPKCFGGTMMSYQKNRCDQRGGTGNILKKV